ncbi:MAG: hypothetical protein ACIAQZ_08785 [Sedimentisphaeraceae bacterium JB056]
MSKLSIFLLTAVIIFAAGCSSPSGSMLLSVDFPQEKTLTYKFVTNRDVVLNLEGDDAEKKKSTSKEQKTTEGLEMVISYTSKGTDVYGNTTIEATCQNVDVKRKTFTNRSDANSDPLNSLKGKSWSFVVNSAGVIQDYSGLETLVKELGEKAISESGKRRIKSPDMIWDFVATQWFMWDALASNDKLYSGIDPGQSWKSILPVPFAVRLPMERHVQYSIDPELAPDSTEIVIDSSYTLRGYKEKDGKLVFDSALPQMPNPYEGSYQTKGMFGFLRNYKADSLDGTGIAKYDIKDGILLSDHQEYKIDMTAGFMFPLGDTTPVLKVNQTIDVELIDEE